MLQNIKNSEEINPEKQKQLETTTKLSSSIDTISDTSNNNNTSSNNMTSSLSSPNSLIINEESPPSLSFVSSPSSVTASSPQSSSFKSNSSRSESPVNNSNNKKSDSDNNNNNLKEDKQDNETVIRNESTNINNNNKQTEIVDYMDETNKLHVASILVDSPTTECSEEQNDNKPASNKRTRNDSELDDSTGTNVKLSRQIDDNTTNTTTTNTSNNKTDESTQKEEKNDSKFSLNQSIQQSVSTTTTTTPIAAPVQPDKYELMQPRLKKFLKIYQLSSRNSLSGPTQNDIENSLNNNTTNQTSTTSTSIVNHINEEQQQQVNNSSSSLIVSKSEPIIPVEIPPNQTIMNHLVNNHQTSYSSTSDSSVFEHTEHNNLSIIANVAAAAAAAAALNKEQKFYQNSVNQLGHQQLQHNHHHHHHHRHHNHPHKRAKYSSNGPINGSSFKSTEPGSNPSSRSNSVGVNGGSNSLNRDQNSMSMNRTNNNSANYLKCIQADLNTSPLMETLLHGERISCFIVGGEKRLCLHDILNTILKDFSVQQINNACQKLQIACLESSSKQLEILKKSHLLPPGAPNCGLLTQTNAERLCSYLMDSSLSIPGPPTPPPPQSTSPSPHHQQSSLSPSSPKKNTLKVVHECFGKTYGHIHMHMYSRSDAACVECDICRKLYTPKNFVCHTHKYEANTRHWGFDSSNWRIYLKLVNNTNQTTIDTKSVLSDIKISNKDNIAANTKVNNSLSEEFEMFKKKFLNSSTSNGLINSTSMNTTSSGVYHQNDMLKRKSFCESDFELKKANTQLQQQTASNKFEQHSENFNKKLLNQSCSLNDLNNHLITTLASSTSNNNGPVSPHQSNINNKPNGLNSTNLDSKSNLNNNNNIKTSIGEHKLLNGLLSKPLNTNNNTQQTGESNTPNSNNNNSNTNMIGLSLTLNNQNQNLLIPTGSVDNLLLKSNKINSNSSTPTPNRSFSTQLPKYMMNDELNKAAAAAAANPQSILFYNLFNSTSNNNNNSNTNKLKDMRQSNSIEINMLEIILNEIDSCVDNKESAERLRQMVTQLHLYFSDKLNDTLIVKNKLLAEFEEFKLGFQNENEQLRCQLKLVHLQNELNKEHYLKSNTTNTSNTSNSSNNLLPIAQSPSQQQQTQPQQHQQSIKTSLNSNSTPNKSPNSLLAASQQFQNILLMQQQQQQHKSQDLQSAAAAAAVQSFPQFFLNHYVPQMNHHHHHQQQQHHHRPTLTQPPSDPLTSTPKKSYMNTSSTYSSPNSTTSSSSSINSSFNASAAKLQAQSANNLIMSLAAKCEPTHHQAV